MRVLIIARFKENGFVPFVTEQVEALKEAGEECRFFPVRGKGIAGYLKQLPELIRTIKQLRPDVVHAHYGLCGLLANLQRSVPVVTTFHGSDINVPSIRRFSRITIRLSSFNIFVSQGLLDKVSPVKNGAVIPCGINVDDYPVVEKEEARRQMGLKQDGKYVLFAGAFDNLVKNASLAKAAISQLPGVQLLELKGYTRHQVAMLMLAADAFLMTSISEGSPQVIKEALACGCPIVSVDVGDVRERIDGLEGCYVSDSCDADHLADLLQIALAFSGKTAGRERILADELDNHSVAKRLIAVYESVLAQ